MPVEKIQKLPILNNQYQFYKYFKENGYSLEIDKIIKNYKNKYLKSD
jgi:hypothetical protein